MFKKSSHFKCLQRFNSYRVFYPTELLNSKVIKYLINLDYDHQSFADISILFN